MLNNQCTSWSILLTGSISLLLISCSVSKKISKSAKEDVITNKALTAAHVGITIFDPAANKYLYNYQGDKYFVPASNTKIPTCYAAMKYLGDSLVAFSYDEDGNMITIQPSGDPTFLHPDFPNQPAFEFLKRLNVPIKLDQSVWDDQPLGSGWAWNDYEEYYMAERSYMPIYGNMVNVTGQTGNIQIVPKISGKIHLDSSFNQNRYVSQVHRNAGDNNLNIIANGNKPANVGITLFSDHGKLIPALLSDTLKLKVDAFDRVKSKLVRRSLIKSQPTDSMLKLMMHRSDNFFAEQSLMMVSNQLFGYMNDSKIIDTLLKTDFKDLPQKPRWADGSGLSRYNLFTPQDFVAILNKMKNEFGMERLKVIMATGGEGTISSYYKTESGFIYGKTGTLSGVVAFSGFLYTKKNKLLIFSTLVNNHQASATDVRRAVEKFLQGVRNNF